MTSQSLRKLQTTLWSTHPKTDLQTEGRSIAQILQDAGLAGLALLTLASGTFADENTGRARFTASDKDAVTASEPAESAADSKRSKSARRMMTVRPATHTRVLPADETPAERLFMEAPASETEISSDASSVQQPSAPQIAAQARQRITGEQDQRYSRTEKSDAGFSARMNYVLSGGVVTSSAESVGEWWEERSGRMLNGNTTQSSPQDNRQPSMQRLASATDRIVNRVTLPDEMEPEVDFYEAGPIAVSAPILQTAGQEESSDSSVPASRLKTDIRSIKPTLGYALKNIDKEQLPEDFDVRTDAGEYVARQASPIVYQWAPTNFYHYPLYFEDPSLERYGHTYHPVVQPFASTGLFATQLVGLPYQMTLNPIHSKQYSLGYYRPGECAPKKHYQIPFNEEATVVEVATIVGLFLIIP